MKQQDRTQPTFNREAYILYRLPESNKIVYQTILESVVLNPESNDYPDDGFLFAPFDTDEHPMFLLKANKTQTLPDSAKFDIPTSTFFTSLYQGESVTKSMYLDKLRKTIKVIREEEHTQKIVLSRSFFKSEKKFENFGPFFNRLIAAYPRSFVYLLNHPTLGTWCGASPELLFSSNNGDGSTVALASTRRLEAFGHEKVQWNDKEIVEQQLVEQYIEDKLDRLVKSYEKKGPETIISGRLAHICSYYNFKIPKSQQFGFVKDLHPTPAICGLPKQNAQAHIKNLETYDRDYYSGFLGLIGTKQATNLYVNLRCFKVFSNGLNLYAGGGITKDSVPELEWTETCNKLDSILRLL